MIKLPILSDILADKLHRETCPIRRYNLAFAEAPIRFANATLGVILKQAPDTALNPGRENGLAARQNGGGRTVKDVTYSTVTVVWTWPLTQGGWCWKLMNTDTVKRNWGEKWATH